MTVSLKYARVERERRWLLGSTPELSGSPMEITDRYVLGTRLRLREVVVGESVVRKLGHKVRLGSDAAEVACTNFYLDDAEWAALSVLPARVLHKQRWRSVHDGQLVAVDVFGGGLAGLVLAEVDRGSGPDRGLPPGFDPVAEVSSDERLAGGVLAASGRDELVATLGDYGVRIA